MWIIAAVACAALMVSCGGEKKGSEDVVAKAKDYVAKIEAAQEKGEYEKAMQLAEEFNKWGESLSEADQKKVAEALGE